MNKNDYIIRLETPADHVEVEYLIRESFWNVYRPGCLEHYVLKAILIFTERVDLLMRLNIGFVITDCQRTQMHHFSCAKN